MKSKSLSILSVLIGGISAVEASSPNIIFFMVDDMGWQDCSLPMWKDTTILNRTFETPNLERLARRGVKFTNAYASAVSSPTRVSLMTGMNPAAHRVTNWTLYKDKSTDGSSSVLNYPAWNVNGLQPVGSRVPQSVEAVTLPQLLKKAGYSTIHVGKAHYGSIGTPGADPLNLGFDVNVAGHAAGGLASYLGEKKFGNTPDNPQTQSPFAIPGLEQYWGEDVFVTEVLTIEALKQLDKVKNSGKPFFLNMCHYAVHVPIEKDVRFYDKYIAKGLSPQWAAYASMVEGVDKSLGDLMDYLEREKLMDNTVIVFMSDNGGLGIQGREPHSSLGAKVNFPLNSGKGSAYEGGVRVPLVISLPDTARHNVTVKSVVEVCDMLPTLMSVANVKHYKTPQKLDGMDILHLINGTSKSVDRTLVWHYPCNWGPTGAGIGTYSSILRGDWKAIYYYDTGKVDMFNISDDIFEVINQGSNPSMARQRKRLLDELTKYLKSKDAQLPSYKNGQMCSYPNGEKFKE